VLSLIIRQSLTVVLGGAVAGIVLAMAGTTLIAKFLYGLTPTDASTIAASTVLLLGVTALAAYLPARRAGRVAPIVALRHE
jgi:putative ABC transport system permease protein